MFKNIRHQHIALFGIAVAIAFFFISRFVLSIGIGIIVFAAIINPGLKDNWRDCVRNPVIVMLTLFFFLVAASGLYSDNIPAFISKLRTKLPFLLLPFALLSVGSFSRKQYKALLYLFVATVLAGALWATGNFLLNYEAIIESYQRAKVMPTPINHIRFSLMVVLATATAAYLFWTKFFFRYRWEPWVMLGVAISLFLFEHLLAVRSGLLAMYLVLFCFTVYFIFSAKQYILGIGMLLAIVIIPIAGYYTVPTIYNKVNYMQHDIHQYLKGNNKDAYSDARRLRSIEIAVRVGDQSPILGVGYGDVIDESDKMYDQYYPETPKDIRVFAHNQFVYLYAALGLIGMLYFTVMILLPVFYRQGYQNFLVATVSIIAISSFMTEHTLETQYGAIFYLLFLCLGLQTHYNPPTDA